MTGSSEVSAVGASLLDKPLPYEQVQKLVKECVRNAIGVENTYITDSQMKFGRKRFANSRERFDEHLQGSSVAKNRYTYRIRPKYIVTFIQYLKAQLLVVSGKTRDVKIEGGLIKNLPVNNL